MQPANDTIARLIAGYRACVTDPSSAGMYLDLLSEAGYPSQTHGTPFYRRIWGSTHHYRRLKRNARNGWPFLLPFLMRDARLFIKSLQHQALSPSFCFGPYTSFPSDYDSLFD